MSKNLGACRESSDQWRPLSDWPEFVEPIKAYEAKSTSSRSEKSNSTESFEDKNPSGKQKPFQSMMGELNAKNLLQEIIPLDATNVNRLTRDPVFWGAFLLGVGPLLICTFDHLQIQNTGMAFLFAGLWAFVFKMLVARNDRNYTLPLAAFFFTGIIGIAVYMFIVTTILPESYMDLPGSPNVLYRLLGSIFCTGITEELCKIAPAVIYLIWKRKDSNPMTVVWVAICSALGFAAFENLIYTDRIAGSAGSLLLFEGEGALALSADAVNFAMLSYVLRSLSCVFGHAVWTGVFAYFISVAFLTGKRYVILCGLGWLLAASFHGFYNWFLGVQPTFAALVDAVAFVLFYGYLIKLRILIGEESSIEFNQ